MGHARTGAGYPRNHSAAAQLRGEAVTSGMAAGLLGVAVMTMAEKAEQAVTRRPDQEQPLA